MAYHVNDNPKHTKLPMTKTGGVWVRKRMVKNEHGKWVRVGRLSKQYYKH